jgi:crotonobetainyl-CoA:carnitine CoA-transferase CaiB-like acyl-CoA transferase
MRPLEGITVLDLTRFLPGAVSTMWLVRYGAEVIKIERPGDGDPARHLGDGSIFAYTNRGKKSVGINLKDSRGRQFFYEMVKCADVLIENFRPGVMDRLQANYETLARSNPQLLYVSLSGYLPESAMGHAAGHDLNYMAVSGMLDLLSPINGSPPVVPRVQVADVVGGSQQVLVGLLLALYARTRTGRGQRVNVSMASGMADLASVPLAAYRHSKAQASDDELLSGSFACYSLYRCKDDGWIAVGAVEPKFWCNLCRELQREDLQPYQFAPEPKRSQVKAVLSEILLQRTAQEWFTLLGARECCITPVRTFAEAYANGHFEGQDIGTSAELTDTGGHLPDASVPALGQHGTEFVEKMRWPVELVTEMKREGILA